MKINVEFTVPVMISTDVTMSITLPMFVRTPDGSREDENRNNGYYAIVPNDLGSKYQPYRLVEVKQYTHAWRIYDNTANDNEVAVLLGKLHAGNLVEISRAEFMTVFAEAIASYESIAKHI